MAKLSKAFLAILSYCTIASVPQIADTTDTHPWEQILRPGCLIQDLGHVYPITDSIHVSIDLSLIPTIERKLAMQFQTANHLSQLLTNSPHLTEEYKTPLSNLLHVSTAALANLLDPLTPSRYKRGLFNIGGNIAHYLFGTTTDDILAQTVKTQNAQISSALDTFSSSFQTLNVVSDKLDMLTATSNTISSSLSTLANQTSQLKDFSLLTVSLTLFSNQIQHLVSDLQSPTSNLVLAAHGEITPSLIPESELTRIINSFTTHSNRQSLLPPSLLY